MCGFCNYLIEFIYKHCSFNMKHNFTKRIKKIILIYLFTNEYLCHNYQNQSNSVKYIFILLLSLVHKKKLDRKSRFINFDCMMVTLRLRSQVLEVQLSFSYINRFVPTMENICQKLDISEI